MNEKPLFIYSKCPRCGGSMQQYESTNSSADFYKCPVCDFRKPIFNGQIGVQMKGGQDEED